MVGLCQLNLFQAHGYTTVSQVASELVNPVGGHEVIDAHSGVFFCYLQLYAGPIVAPTVRDAQGAGHDLV